MRKSRRKSCAVEGDAESIKIYADAYGNDPTFFAFYRSLQAYRDSLSGSGTTLVLSPDSEFFKYLEGGPSVPQPSGSAPRARHEGFRRRLWPLSLVIEGILYSLLPG